jgi:type 1 fimbria pilin
MVQVYVRGMDDLEFTTIHDTSNLTNVLPGPYLEPQGMGTMEDEEIVCEPIGGTLVAPPLTHLQMTDCMSESYSSLLQLLKTGYRLKFPWIITVDEVSSISFAPSAWNAQLATGVGGVTRSVPPFFDSFATIIKGCYAYQRGGFELSIVPTSDTSRNNVMATISNRNNSPNFENSGLLNRLNGNFYSLLGPNNTFNTHFASNNSNYGLSVTMPYRSLTRVNPIAAVGDRGDLIQRQQMRSKFVAAVSRNDYIMLRPGEDFQLMYWVGVCPVGDPAPL